MNKLKIILNYNAGKPLLNILLTFLFIALNIILSCSNFVINFLLLVANSNAMKIYDDFIDIAFCTIGIIIFYVLMYLIIKINIFVVIYELSRLIDKSSRIYNFLCEFLNNFRFRCQVILLAIGVDIITLFIQHKCYGGHVSSILLKQCGGVTISYLAFALYKK